MPQSESPENESLSVQALCFHACSSVLAKKNLKWGGVPHAEAVEEGVQFAHGETTFTFCFARATTVEVRVGGQVVSLCNRSSPNDSSHDRDTTPAGGVWVGSASFLRTGFHYCFLYVDGQEVLSPYLPIGFGYARPTNYIDVPPALGSEDWRLPYLFQSDDVARGSVSSVVFRSSVTGRAEKLNVYLPPTYDSAAASGEAQRMYPVLYLQHGLGENENGWVYQGKLNYIADNLIHRGAAKEMIIVMCDGMLPDRTGSADNFFSLAPLAYAELLTQEIIPFVEHRFRASRDAAHRAVAGLSMGSMQAFRAAATHPELFSAVALLSGFMRSAWSGIGTGEDDTHVHQLLTDSSKAGAFSEHIKVFYRYMGAEDPFFHIFEEDDAILARMSPSIHAERHVYPEHEHTWQVWRLAIADFLPRLF